MFARLLGVLLTFWNDYVLFTIKKIMIVVLQKRPIPKHVSFIMDGNRRFAMASHIPRAEGHLHGFEKLLEVIEWCLHLGVREVSLYGFSIENFKRSKDEVDSLMELAFTKLSEAMKEKDWADKHGMRLRFVGKIELLPERLRKLVAESNELFENQKSETHGVLNLCFSYTSRDEIATTMSDIVAGVRAGEITPDDITEQLFEESLYIPSDTELLVRTSGEKRFSDFLLWQGSNSCMISIDTLWPDLSFYDFFCLVRQYQDNYPVYAERNLQQPTKNNETKLNERSQAFVNKLKQKRKEHTHKLFAEEPLKQDDNTPEIA